MRKVNCPHCNGIGGFIDLNRCGKNCRSIDPPTIKCNFCNGRTVVTQDEYDEYKGAEDGDTDD